MAEDVRWRDYEELICAQLRRRAEGSARIAFGDIVIFFGVLLVGFAYLWRRGDLDWVRSTAAEQPIAEPSESSAMAERMSTRSTGG